MVGLLCNQYGVSPTPPPINPLVPFAGGCSGGAFGTVPISVLCSWSQLRSVLEARKGTELLPSIAAFQLISDGTRSGDGGASSHRLSSTATRLTCCRMFASASVGCRHTVPTVPTVPGGVFNRDATGKGEALGGPRERRACRASALLCARFAPSRFHFDANPAVAIVVATAFDAAV